MNKSITTPRDAEYIASANKLSRTIAFACLVAALVLLATGCKSTTAHYSAKTNDWKITDRRLLVSTAAEIVATVSTNGDKSISIKAKSDPAAQALADGLKMGLDIGKAMAK